MAYFLSFLYGFGNKKPPNIKIDIYNQFFFNHKYLYLIILK